ncbi:MAG: cytochrome c oxidase assembly protein [Acidimicrobiales bacterium]
MLSTAAAFATTALHAGVVRAAVHTVTVGTVATLRPGASPVRVLSPPVRLHILLYGWQTGWLSLVTAAIDATLAIGYVLATVHLAKKGRTWSPWRTTSFLAGIATVVIATVSGFAAYDSSVFYMHVIQHLLLMNLAPIFLVLGAPVTLALQASGRHTQTTVLRVLHHPVVEFVTNPLVVLAVFSVTMIGFFLTPLYRFSLEHPLFHDFTHLHFLIVGYLYWSLVVGIDPSRWRLSVPMKLGFLAMEIPIATILGIALTETRTSIAPAFHTVLDTHIGGSILWIVSEVFTFSAITIVVVQWMHSDLRDAARLDRRADADLAVTEVTVVDGRLVSVPGRNRAPETG